jgi:IrrE N-terminal-like domain
MNSAANDQVSIQFERGFKTWAENAALSIRARLGLPRVAPLAPERLAYDLGIRLWRPEEVPGLPPETLTHLLSAGADEWSALTLQVGPLIVVIVNSRHSAARQASDVMHELSHLIRRHAPTRVYVSAETGVHLHTYNALQEAEASWLAGCLLVPREALVWCKVRRLAEQEACTHFGVSAELLAYRMNVTGINRQFGPSFSSGLPAP